MGETDAPESGEGYINSYVAFMDILGFSALTDRADSDPDWRKFLTDTIRLLRTRLPTQIEQNRSEPPNSRTASSFQCNVPTKVFLRC